MDVRLSGTVVGSAETWVDAEQIVARTLEKRGKRVPEWSDMNTREHDGEFQFVMRRFKDE